MLLGRKPVRYDVRTLLLKSLMATIPAWPPARDWAAKLPDDLGMLGNDVKSNCTMVGGAHLVQVWTSQIGLIQCPTQDQIDTAYRAISPDDTGADMLTALNRWRNVGIGDHRIGAFAKTDHTDIDHCSAALDFFGGLYVGANLPNSARNTSKPWANCDDRPGSWGGHCMAVHAYDRSGVSFITWGRRQRATWDWWAKYVDESYAIFSQDWIESDGTAPVGLPVEALQKYLTQLAA